MSIDEITFEALFPDATTKGLRNLRHAYESALSDNPSLTPEDFAVRIRAEQAQWDSVSNESGWVAGQRAAPGSGIQRVYSYITEQLTTGRVPTQREIAAAVNLSVSSVYRYIRILKKQQKLDATPHPARALRLGKKSAHGGM